MNMTRRQFIQMAASVAGAAAIKVAPTRSAQEGDAMSPAINPVYLTGSTSNWPLKELAAAGYRALELTPACFAHAADWKPAADRAGLRLLSVNALPELRPYLTGSLSDAVAGNGRDTVQRLLQVLDEMRKQHIPLLIVAPSRLAENYQTPEEARALLVGSLRELAQAGDTTILLEAAPFRMFASSAEIAALVDEVAMPNVAAALDVGHAMLSGENPGKAAGVLGARLRYVQVHDADVRAGLPRLDRHLPMGEGSVQQEDVRAALGHAPFAITIAPRGDPVAAARAALQWLG